MFCWNTELYCLFPVVFLSTVVTIYSDATSASPHTLVSPHLQFQHLAYAWMTLFCLSFPIVLWILVFFFFSFKLVMQDITSLSELSGGDWLTRRSRNKPRTVFSSAVVRNSYIYDIFSK